MIVRTRKLEHSISKLATTLSFSQATVTKTIPEIYEYQMEIISMCKFEVEAKCSKKYQGHFICTYL